VPVVIQYNKLDLDETADPGSLPLNLNTAGNPEVYASAIQQRGVLETLECISRAVVSTL
jgi:hypothetical protein